MLPPESDDCSVCVPEDDLPAAPLTEDVSSDPHDVNIMHNVRSRTNRTAPLLLLLFFIIDTSCLSTTLDHGRTALSFH